MTGPGSAASPRGHGRPAPPAARRARAAPPLRERHSKPGCPGPACAADTGTATGPAAAPRRAAPLRPAPPPLRPSLAARRCASSQLANRRSELLTPRPPPACRAPPRQRGAGLFPPPSSVSSRQLGSGAVYLEKRGCRLARSDACGITGRAYAYGRERKGRVLGRAGCYWLRSLRTPCPFRSGPDVSAAVTRQRRWGGSVGRHQSIGTARTGTPTVGAGCRKGSAGGCEARCGAAVSPCRAAARAVTVRLLRRNAGRVCGRVTARTAV